MWGKTWPTWKGKGLVFSGDQDAASFWEADVQCGTDRDGQASWEAGGLGTGRWPESEVGQGTVPVGRVRTPMATSPFSLPSGPRAHIPTLPYLCRFGYLPPPTRRGSSLPSHHGPCSQVLASSAWACYPRASLCSPQ